MPFTLSHPAAAALVWPLDRQRRLSLSALAIGSMVPDFEFFIHLRPIDVWGHTLVGFFRFCLPVALISLAAWELIARDAVRHLLAMPVHENAKLRTWQWWAGAVIAIAAGVALHIAWDGLTHEGGWGERLIPSLSAIAFPLRGRPMPWGVLVDYASTIVGGIVVVMWLGSELRRAHSFAAVAHTRWRWFVLSLLVVSAIGVGLWNGLRGPPSVNYWTGEMWLARFTIGAMLGFGVALLAFGVLHRLRGRSTLADA